MKMTRYDMYGNGLFVLIGDVFCLCEMDEPIHLTVIRSFKSGRQARRFASEKGVPVIEE